jgi:hypothetical protein
MEDDLEKFHEVDEFKEAILAIDNLLKEMK